MNASAIVVFDKTEFAKTIYKKLAKERVVPTISAIVSDEISVVKQRDCSLFFSG
jgi:hypothetical protein